MPDYVLEMAHGAEDGRRVIGVDEAGRGPWAGPVTAAAVWLVPGRLPGDLTDALDDSKKLARPTREALFEVMLGLAGAGDPPLRLGLGEASVGEIDRMNILAASLTAMGRAVAALAELPDAALVDGNRAPDLPCPVTTVVRGDGRSLSIAAASIAAKVTRDRLMARLAEAHPGYGWERNAGYGTAQHRAAIARLGLTPHHRRSFRPVREALESAATP